MSCDNQHVWYQLLSLLLRMGLTKAIHQTLLRYWRAWAQWRLFQTLHDIEAKRSYRCYPSSWWHHQMKTFSALLAICVGNSPVTSDFLAQRPVTRSFDVFLICVGINSCINNREAGDLRRHHPLWRHCNVAALTKTFQNDSIFIWVNEGKIRVLFYEIWVHFTRYESYLRVWPLLVLCYCCALYRILSHRVTITMNIAWTGNRC